jgi:hypothetical protein
MSEHKWLCITRIFHQLWKLQVRLVKVSQNTGSYLQAQENFTKFHICQIFFNDFIEKAVKWFIWTTYSVVCLGVLKRGQHVNNK